MTPPLRTLVVFFVVSTLINKSLMFYFGINYSNHPGHGYGWGLFGTVAYMLGSAGYLLFRFREKD